MPASSSDTILGLIQSGKMKSDPKASLDPRIYDPSTGKPIEVGNTDKNVIGADDKASFEYRADSAFPDLPSQVKDAEVKFILPMARSLASKVGITVVDESMYSRMVEAIRSKFLFVALNLKGVSVSDGVASWIGLIVVCKRHPVVLVQFRLKISTGQIGVYRLKLWEKKGERYLMHGDREGKRFLSREESLAMILNYLNREGVIPGI